MISDFCRPATRADTLFRPTRPRTSTDFSEQGSNETQSSKPCIPQLGPAHHHSMGNHNLAIPTMRNTYPRLDLHILVPNLFSLAQSLFPRILGSQLLQLGLKSPPIPQRLHGGDAQIPSSHGVVVDFSVVQIRQFLGSRTGNIQKLGHSQSLGPPTTGKNKQLV